MHINPVLDAINKVRGLGSGDQCYDLLYAVTRCFQVKKILDIGTHRGASTITMIQAVLDNGETPHVWTVDNWTQGDMSQVARAHVRDAGFDQYVSFHLADSNQILPSLFETIGPVDLVFIDGDHSLHGVTADYQNTRRHAKVLVFHDAQGNDVKKVVAEAEKDGWRAMYFPTRFVEGDGHPIGISVLTCPADWPYVEQVEETLVPYSLAILAFRYGFEKPFTSVQVITQLLVEEWRKLPNVSLQIRDIENYENWPPDCRADVCLIHAYWEQWKNVAPYLRERFKLTSSFMEVPFDVDLPYTFAGEAGVPIKFPAFFPVESEVVPSRDGGVLLDHLWKPMRDVDNEWLYGLYEELAPLSAELHIAQCQRYEDEEFPPWIHRVPLLPWSQYLAATARFRFFVMTHYGTYNAAVVDMAARRKIVMGPSAVVLPDHFSLGLVRETPTPQDVVRIIQSNPPSPPVPDAITPLEAAVARMNRDFSQRVRLLD